MGNGTLGENIFIYIFLQQEKKISKHFQIWFCSWPVITDYEFDSGKKRFG